LAGKCQTSASIAFVGEGEGAGASSSSADIGSSDSSSSGAVIDSHPAFQEQSGEAFFSFHCNQVQCYFQCRLNANDWEDCESPKKYIGLANGEYVFEVLAVDEQGQGVTAPASFVWNVALATEPSITEQPATEPSATEIPAEPAPEPALEQPAAEPAAMSGSQDSISQPEQPEQTNALSSPISSLSPAETN
jgi:hypothetical protein